MAAVLLALAALATLAYVDHEERQSIVGLVAKDVPAAAGRLAQRYPMPPKSCSIARPLDDHDLLAGALAAVESLNTGFLERNIEEVLVRLAVFARLPVPDFSIGPGQIRPSTAKAAIRDGKAGGLSPGDLGSAQQAIALQLLDPCSALDWAARILKGYEPAPAAPTGRLNREAVMDLAGKYNSQMMAATNEAVVANYLYRELIYQVFQEYKFRLNNPW